MQTHATLDLGPDLGLEVLDERRMKEIDGGCPILDIIRGLIFPYAGAACDCGECGAGAAEAAV